MRRFFGLFAILVLSSLQSSAYTPKEGNVSASLGPYLYKTDFNAGDNRAKSPYLGDVGLLVQGDSSEVGSLEISLFHLNKIFFRDQHGNFQAEQLEMMQVGLGYRWWIHHYLSAALSFYSSYAMKEPTVVHSTSVSGDPLDTSARDITEYGFEASLQTEVWSYDRYAVILDARYARSVTNKIDESGNHYGLLVALRYFIQAKQGHKNEDSLK
jgi:hypothetical protein